MENKKHLEHILNTFEKFSYCVDSKIERDIEENRKGNFVIKFQKQDGSAAKGVKVKVRQLSHEFKFGATLFYLDQFPDEARKKAYREKFLKLFNYAVLPLYWDTLEPVEGEPRFAEDAPFVSRRPPLDTMVRFCHENNLRMKGHCLAYNSFQPDWISDCNRTLKIQFDKRVKAIADRYADEFEDLDVINEMISIYKNCYKGNGMRNLQLTDDRNYEKSSFDAAKRAFPHSRLFWNEGMEETFGNAYRGYRSFYYMTVEKYLREGVPIEGLGMQYHMYNRGAYDSANPLRLLDALDLYGEFGLPIHISEVSVPSYGSDPEALAMQAEITKRLFKLWFSRKHCESIVWWNIADGTAYGDENEFCAGIIDNNCCEKPVYHELDQLINHEWHTEFETESDGELRFAGFYGEYEITVTDGETSRTEKVRLTKDTTGFDNRLCDFRSKTIMIS